ncbi:MAG: hypothetical protein ABIN96_04745 [Rubrivivax sp.]
MPRNLSHLRLHRQSGAGLAACLAAWLACATLLLLQACASVGGSRTISIGTDRIEAQMLRSFPIDRRLLEIVDVRLSDPELTMQPERNRIAAVLRIGARMPYFGSTGTGRLSFDAGLRVDPSDHSLRLSKVRVQDFRFNGSDDALRSTAERIAAAVAERMLEDLPIVSLDDRRVDDLKRAGLRPTTATVTSRGVDVQLEPVAR